MGLFSLEKYSTFGQSIKKIICDYFDLLIPINVHDVRMQITFYSQKRVSQKSIAVIW